MAPLHQASLEGVDTVMMLLLEYGMNVDNWDEKGQMLLHLAASCGYSKVVQLLLDHGADVNA